MPCDDGDLWNLTASRQKKQKSRDPMIYDDADVDSPSPWLAVPQIAVHGHSHFRLLVQMPCGNSDPSNPMALRKNSHDGDHSCGGGGGDDWKTLDGLSLWLLHQM